MRKRWSVITHTHESIIWTLINVWFTHLIWCDLRIFVRALKKKNESTKRAISSFTFRFFISSFYFWSFLNFVDHDHDDDILYRSGYLCMMQFKGHANRHISISTVVWTFSVTFSQIHIAPTFSKRVIKKWNKHNIRETTTNEVTTLSSRFTLMTVLVDRCTTDTDLRTRMDRMYLSVYAMCVWSVNLNSDICVSYLINLIFSLSLLLLCWASLLSSH